MTSSIVIPSQNPYEKINASIFRVRSVPTTGGLEEIHQKVPPGVLVKKAIYGHGLFASDFFPKGSTVYIGRQLVIPNEFAEFKLVLDGTDQTFLLNTETHSVEFNEKQRWLYLFDSFMNHSCEPTTFTRQTPDQRLANEYETVALVDINPGDEITCDYNLFEYDCHGKEIEECLCGSINCIGRIAGYKYLSTPEKQLRLPSVEIEVLQALSSDPANKFIYISDLKCPKDRVSIETESGSFSLAAARDFEKDEIVYTNESLIFEGDCSIVLEIAGERKWLNNLTHTVNRDNGKREFFYFDSFQNHSCDPNTVMIYRTENEYDIIATRKIAKGEDITCDYATFDDKELDGTSFQCKCGAKICRGFITA